jgi:hypothetical protein
MHSLHGILAKGVYWGQSGALDATKVSSSEGEPTHSRLKARQGLSSTNTVQPQTALGDRVSMKK